MSIATECMIVSLHVSLWTGHKLDKETTRKVVQDAGATSDAARVNKHLVPKDTMGDVMSAASALRTHFYAQTLPWKDNGDRVLTRKMYSKFMLEHGELRARFEREVKDFLENRYPAARDQAAFRMGTLFKDTDYPRPDTLASKFRVFLDIDAITSAGDFRCEVDNSEEVREQIERSMQDRLSRAMGDVWQRLSTIIGSLAERLAEDGIIRKATLTNLHEIVELLPALNIMDCPNLEKVRQDIQQTLLGYDVKDLAIDQPAMRKAVGGEAARIMDEMRGYMRAFGGGE